MRYERRTWLMGMVIALAGSFAPLQAEDGAELPRELPTKVKKPTVTAKELGSLTGKIVFQGERPEAEALRVLSKRPTPEQIYYSTLQLKDQSLLIGADGGLANVVVWVADPNIPVPVAPRIRRLPEPAVLKFQDGLFRPRVLAFESWRVLELRNEDAFTTNFHWWAAGEDSLNQTISAKSHAQFMIPAKERPIRLSNSIYTWPKAWLFPVAHPYYAVTDSDGSFRIDRLPVGNWEFHAWHERWGHLNTAEWPAGKFKQEIRSGQNELGTIAFKPPAAKPSVEKALEDPRLAELRKLRESKNERGNASEFVGKWKMKLPAGFEYVIQLEQLKDGLLQMTSDEGGLLLLGIFACRGNELQLVKSRHDRIFDYVWTYRDGKFVLTKDEQGHGGDYLHAELTRLN